MPSTKLERSLPILLLVAGVVATLAGLFVYELLDELPTRPALLLLLIALLALGSSVVLDSLLKLPRSIHLGLIFLLALVFFVGIKPILATVLVLLAAVGIGWRLVPATIPARATVATIAGLGLIAGGLGWVVTLEWHHRLAYLLGALAIIVLWRHSIASALRSLHLDVSEFGLDRDSAAFAVLALGLASTALWLPSMLFDDLSYHLGLPMQLQHGAYYRADPATQLWALAPWAGDLIQALPQVISRAESRGAVNAIWLITAAVLLWQIGRELGLGQNLRWLTLALFASFPLTPALMMGLHTEGPSIAIILAIALVILRTGPEPDVATLRLLAILAGLALGLKLTNALSLIPLGLWLLIRWRGRLPWPHVPLAVALFALIALPSTVHAWLLAGNPVLPLFNDVFLSEYAHTERFRDQRWSAPVGLDILWRTSFHVMEYLTARPGAAGFALVTLAGGIPLALARPDLRPYLLVALAIFLLPLLVAPYFRYAQPGVVALMPVLVAALCHNRSRISAGVLAALVLLQFAYHANSLWMLRLGALETRLLQGQDALIERFVPERLIARQVLIAKPDARIFLASRERPYVAIFNGQAFTWSWYDHQLRQAGHQANAEPSGVAWQRLWADHGLTHVLVAGQTEASISAAINDAVLVMRAGDASLYKLATEPTSDPVIEPEVDLSVIRDKARRRLLFGPPEP